MCRLFRSDWQPVWAHVGIWKISNYNYGKFIGDTTEKSTYEIEFSQRRKRYRLKLGGYTPKEHPNYSEVVKVFNQFVEDQHNQTDPEGFDFKSDPTR